MELSPNRILSLWVILICLVWGHHLVLSGFVLKGVQENAGILSCVKHYGVWSEHALSQRVCLVYNEFDSEGCRQAIIVSGPLVVRGLATQQGGSTENACRVHFRSLGV